MTKKIVVIGAGASGLCAIKSCVDEGLEPVCYERTEEIGGLWNYKDEVKDGQSCVMKTTVINTSKEMMSYSDFPIPKEFPNFMHNRKVMEYFRMYNKEFDLDKHIKYAHEIMSVSQAPDYASTGRWTVEVKDLKSEKVESIDYDGVMVCTGHHADKNYPDYDGEKDFQGKTVHTHDYRTHVGYEDKRVLVVGIGNSGGDVAVELSKVAKQVYLSTRRGAWVLNRVWDNGDPVDMCNSTRAKIYLQETLPVWLTNGAMEHKINQRFDHSRYGLKPNYHVMSSHPMVNDELPNRIACGTVIVKPDVKKITKTGVIFDDGTEEENIDSIIYGTGFTFGFPFIKHPALEVKKNKANLYKFCFPPDLEKGTLAVIGFVQPWGAIMPISEMQCRWAARVFKGVVSLPSKNQMWADVRKKEREMEERYTDTQRHTVQVDFIPFMDELAEQINCKPNIKSLIMQDPRLGLKCLFGPCTPYQYRLAGPGTWNGARGAILTQWNRTYYPLATRKAVPPDNPLVGMVIQLVFFVCMAMFIQWVVRLII